MQLKSASIQHIFMKSTLTCRIEGTFISHKDISIKNTMHFLMNFCKYYIDAHRNLDIWFRKKIKPSFY